MGRKRMGGIDDQIKKSVVKIAAERSLSPEKFDELVERTIQEAVPKLVNSTIRALKRNAPAMLKERRRTISGFEARNLKRWRKAFDLIEVLWVSAAEMGEEFNREFRPKAASSKDYRFEALIHLHARALLVSSEAICLMKGGYADGALGRWRVLHEVNVVAQLLRQAELDVSHRYLASLDFQSHKAAVQLKRYADRANLTPFSDDEIAAIEQRCNVWVDRFGNDMWSDYGWAAPALKKRKPNLLDLEEATGLDHWRPRYRWASRHNHAAYQPAQSLLGASEAETNLLVIGPSNSGLTDPLHMTAISLSSVTGALLMSKPNIERHVFSQILLKLSDEIGPLAFKLEKKTLLRERQRRDKAPSPEKRAKKRK